MHIAVSASELCKPCQRGVLCPHRGFSCRYWLMNGAEEDQELPTEQLRLGQEPPNRATVETGKIETLSMTKAERLSAPAAVDKQDLWSAAAAVVLGVGTCHCCNDEAVSHWSSDRFASRTLLLVRPVQQIVWAKTDLAAAAAPDGDGPRWAVTKDGEE